MKRFYTLLLFLWVLGSSTLSHAQFGYFEDVGFTFAEDTILATAISLPFITVDGQFKSMVADQDLNDFFQKEFENIDFENAFPHFTEEQRPHTIQDIIVLYQEISRQVDRDIRSKKNPLAPLEESNSQQKMHIIMNDPSFHIQLSVQSQMFMKTLVEENRLSRLPGFSEDQLQEYYQIMETKNEQVEAIYPQYGLNFPDRYRVDEHRVDQILYDIFFMNHLMIYQWEELLEALRAQGIQVTVLEINETPNAVFTRDNYALVGNKYFGAQFGLQSFERSLLSQDLYYFIRDHFHQDIEKIDGISHFQGGDLRFDEKKDVVWLGFGETGGLMAPTIKQSVESICKHFDRCHLLEKKKRGSIPNHLDMYFAIVGDYVIYEPDAFTQESNLLIEQHFAPEYRIRISEEQLQKGMANLLLVGNDVFMSHVDELTKSKLQKSGFEVHIIDVSTFLLNGFNGGIHCMTNEAPITN